MPKYNFVKAFTGKANRGIAKTALKSFADHAMKTFAGSGAYRYKRARRSAFRGSGAFQGSGAYRKGRRRYSSRRIGSAPTMRSYKARGSDVQRLVVSHREYIGNISSSPATTSASTGALTPFFQVSRFIQPASAALFPWLSGIAPNYVKYRFRKLIFSLKSLVSEGTANTGGTVTGLGEWAMACDYNVNNSAFASGDTGTTSTTQNSPAGNGLIAFPDFNNMLNSEGGISTKPSNGMSFGVEMNKGDVPYKWYFTLQDNESLANQSSTTQGFGQLDMKLYSPGLMQVASQGIPSVVTGGKFQPVALGQMWVEYVVEFEGAIVPFKKPNSAVYVGGTGTQADLFQGTGVKIYDNIWPDAVMDVTTTANVIQFPVGATEGIYEIIISVIGDSTANSQMTVAFTRCTTYSGNYNSITGVASAETATDQVPNATTPSAQFLFRHMVILSNASAIDPALCTYTITTSPANQTSWEVRVHRIPDGQLMNI